jgi:hypothetical protein
VARNKSSFVFYCDWKDTFDALEDKKAGELIKHLLAYVSDENPETDDPIIKAVFAGIKNTLKRDLRKWDEIRQKRSEAGKISANKRQQVLTSVESVEQTPTNSTVSVSVSGSVSERKKKYAEFVTMKEHEYKKLIDEYGLQKTDYMIKTLDNYKGSKGKKYKSDYRAILSWVVDKCKDIQKDSSTNVSELFASKGINL